MRSAAAMTALLALVLSAGAQTNPAPDGLLQRMERIIIPAAEFREARATDVLDFLFEASTASDPDSDRPFGLISPPKTVPVFELEDGSAPDFPPLSFRTQRLTMLQTVDLICELMGIQYDFGESGPEFFLSDGRRLVRKEVPAPPPESLPSADAGDEWGFGDVDLAGPVDALGPAPDGVDWEPLVRSYAAAPAEREVLLKQMGFACTRHKGEYAHLRDPAPRAAGLHPMDYILGERQEGETRWTVRIFIDGNGQADALAIHPYPGF